MLHKYLNVEIISKLSCWAPRMVLWIYNKDLAISFMVLLLILFLIEWLWDVFLIKILHLSLVGLTQFSLKINTQVVVVGVVKCLRICNLDPQCTLFFSVSVFPFIIVEWWYFRDFLWMEMRKKGFPLASSLHCIQDDFIFSSFSNKVV